MTYEDSFTGQDPLPPRKMKLKRGGYRPNSGREKREGPTKPISIRLDLHIYELWKAEKKRLKMTGPRFMAFLLNK